MRKLYWYISTYIRKHGLLFLVTVVGAILFFWLVIPMLNQRITLKKRLYIAVVGQYSLSSLPTAIKNQMSVGLTTVGNNLEAEPSLAERWAVENEGKQYRFVLKKGVYWQDGSLLTPADINYNFSDVETISTPNDVIFTLPEVFAPFPLTVSEPLLKSVAVKHFLFPDTVKIVGIGQYRMISYRLQGSYLKEFQLEGSDARYIYRFYLTEDEAVQAFKKGEVDVLLNLSSCYDLCSWQHLEIDKELAYNRYLAVFFNNSDPLLTKNIRQALSYALSKDYGEARAIGPINPKSWAYLEGGKDYAKDWDRAADRLIAEMPREPLHFELTTTAGFSADADTMKQEWEAFGQYAAQKCRASNDVQEKNLCDNLLLQIAIKISSFPDTNNYQLMLMGQETNPDPDQYLMWHSSQSTNFTHYKNTRIDSLLENGRHTFDQEQRKLIYQEFQQYLLEDPPAIFLRYLDNYSIAR